MNLKGRKFLHNSRICPPIAQKNSEKEAVGNANFLDF